jgi:hypothetical protein
MAGMRRKCPCLSLAAGFSTGTHSESSYPTSWPRRLSRKREGSAKTPEPRDKMNDLSHGTVQLFRSGTLCDSLSSDAPDAICQARIWGSKLKQNKRNRDVRYCGGIHI